ncbi:HAD family hydrolase [Candidatus Merdisoma sp. JLR.KK011]|uniref:HAD family hydrolase n=1 Tax=Candidatus Merdisoma sp. JLR.KK011 TaxID=3114299 RepID=UPI002FF1C484
MIKNAIFDVDGTLLDSMFIWDTLGETYLRSIGYTPKENLNETFKNMSLYQAACYYISEYGVTLSVEEIMDGVNLMIRDFYLNDVKLKPYAADFLQRLNSKGIRMCIATATDKIIVEAVLEKCDGFNTVAVFDEFEKQQDKVKNFSDYFLKDHSNFETFWNFVLNI